MSNRAEPNSVRRVAVVAIHGVADQQPNDTAHRISNLLMMHLPEAYTGFVETDVRIGVQAVHLRSESAEEAEDHADERSLKGRIVKEFRINPAANSVQRAQRRAIARANAGEAAGPIENLQQNYMREQLAEYRPNGQDAVYESVRLGASRLPSGDARDQCDVHVFEMYWADISRAAGGLRRLVVEFYLLLFFLCSLGRHSIEFARVAFAKAQQVKWWERFGQCQRVAESLLVIGLPILNLCLLGLGAAMLPKHLDNLPRPATFGPEYSYSLALDILVCLLALIAAGATLYHKREQWFRKLGWPLSVLALLGCSTTIYFAFKLISRGWQPLVLLSAIAWLLAAAAILWIMYAYRKRKPGALAVAAVAVAIVTGIFFGHPAFTPKADVHDILDAIMFATEATFTALCLCWLWFSLCYWGLCVAGYFAVRTVKPEGVEQLAVARRVRWTVHLTLVLPAVVVALSNVLIWKALLILTWRFIPDDNNFYAPVLLARWIDGTTLVKFTHKMVDLTAGPYFTYAFAGIAVMTAIFVWALLPVLVTELQVPDRKHTVWLGGCLDRAYRFALVPGLAMSVVVLLTPALYALTYLDPHYTHAWPDWMAKNPGRALTMAASALLLIVLGSRLPFKAPGKVLRNAIDIALDITNWLRLNPKNTNPKARISARFVSLLRHIHNWRDPEDGSPYSGIVIIAHSQGTVIGAEVLRFISEEEKLGAHDPLLKHFGNEIPLYFFTMGSPLRQLYSLRFPHHYGWARPGDESGEKRPPNPELLRVTKWVNVYRSADYVGRYLWRDDDTNDRWEFKKYELGAERCEWCLGAGAHNHYWDETAREVAEELDQLIQEAARNPIPGRGGRFSGITRETGI